MVIDDKMGDDAWEDETTPVLPFGEEGMFFTAAGGEHAIWEEFFEDGKQYVAANIGHVGSLYSFTGAAGIPGHGARGRTYAIKTGSNRSRGWWMDTLLGRPVSSQTLRRMYHRGTSCL